MRLVSLCLGFIKGLQVRTGHALQGNAGGTPSHNRVAGAVILGRVPAREGLSLKSTVAVNTDFKISDHVHIRCIKVNQEKTRTGTARKGIIPTTAI